MRTSSSTEKRRSASERLPLHKLNARSYSHPRRLSSSSSSSSSSSPNNRSHVPYAFVSNETCNATATATHKRRFREVPVRSTAWIGGVCLMFFVVVAALANHATEFTSIGIGLGLLRNLPHRRLYRNSTSEDLSTIRYLSLGGPSTWGVGLEHPEPVPAENGGFNVHDAAYPYRLSPQVNNIAQRIGGPTLAALCSQSLIAGTSVDTAAAATAAYDVITMEFSDFSETAGAPALLLLAQRLRRRFPNALLVFVQLWSPAQYQDATTGQTFSSWRQRQAQLPPATTDNSNTDWESDSWHASLSEHDWVLSPKAKTATVELQAIADQVGGHLVDLAPPQDALHGLETAHKWFVELLDDQDDKQMQYTLSTRGHMVTSSHIQSIVDREKVLYQLADVRNQLGDWGSGDQCQLWYDAPTTATDNSKNNNNNNNNVVKYSSSMKMEEFAPDKFALAVPSPKGGTIVVNNPFEEDRMLYLTYMTTSAGGHSNKVYPKVQAQIQGGGGGVWLDPYHEDNADDRHVTRTTAIGKVPPRTGTQITITPLQETSAPFRLVGASLLAPEKSQLGLHSHVDLDLQGERVHARRRTEAWESEW